MQSKIRLKHLLHCFILLSVIITTQYFVNVAFQLKVPILRFTFMNQCDSVGAIVITLIASIYCYLTAIFKILSILAMARGLILFDCFPDPVETKVNIRKLPLISFRVVTRGDYPDLIKKNLEINQRTCFDAGLRHFVIEIVTEKTIENLPENKKVKQIVVPKTYRTAKGTLFKGRNLQYCLEDNVSCLTDNDWIVHLDEDSVLTRDSIWGLTNFIHEGVHSIGQGIIIYDIENKTSYLTKLIMGTRLAMDYGYMRASCLTSQNADNALKGSFVACKVKVEKDISFDGGLYSSVVEFIYFSNIASKKGYTIGWIEGEIHEIGAVSVSEVIVQMTRCIFGFRLLLKCPEIKSRNFITRMMAGMLLFTISYPFVLLFNLIFPLSLYPRLILSLLGLGIAFDVYVGIFALLKLKNATKLDFIAMFLINLVIGSVFAPLVASITYVKVLREKNVRFQITKKTL